MKVRNLGCWKDNTVYASSAYTNSSEKQLRQQMERQMQIASSVDIDNARPPPTGIPGFVDNTSKRSSGKGHPVPNHSDEKEGADTAGTLTSNTTFRVENARAAFGHKKG